MQQQNQMLYGGGNNGLGRFKSAPAAWFDSLLEEDVHVQLPPPPPLPPTPTQRLPPLPNLRNSSIYDPNTLFDTNFTRHNTSPPQLLATLSLPVGSVDCFSASGGGSSNYDILSCLDLPTSETPGDSDSTQQQKQPSLSVSVKGEQTFNDVEMEKLFQDSVPCRVRAKRGCATHPRSIAERVRRTRISDRIRKLQELVPNMDKQTNTADMLDEAVEYVKLLQKQIQELTEHQKQCKCLGRE